MWVNLEQITQPKYEVIVTCLVNYLLIYTFILNITFTKVSDILSRLDGPLFCNTGRQNVSGKIRK